MTIVYNKEYYQSETMMNYMRLYCHENELTEDELDTIIERKQQDDEHDGTIFEEGYFNMTQRRIMRQCYKEYFEDCREKTKKLRQYMIAESINTMTEFEGNLTIIRIYDDGEGQIEDIVKINCYKVYCVETAIAIFNKIHIMFGTHALDYGLDYETLILNKVAEGDTSVLRLAIIHGFVKNTFHSMK